MSDLQLFRYDGRDIRAGQDERGKWVVAKDVVEAVGAGWAGLASIKHVPEKWRGVKSVLTPFGEQQMVVLYQEGMNFYLFRSDKPDALPFQEWLAGTVLPSIQNTGSYSVEEKPQFYIPPTYHDALRLAADQAEQIAALTPKAEFHDAIAASDDCISVQTMAKLLGTGQNLLFAWMRGNKLLMAGGERHNLPYQEYLDSGYFKVIEQPFPTGDGTKRVSCKTLITGKGQVWLERKWRGREAAQAN